MRIQVVGLVTVVLLGQFSLAGEPLTELPNGAHGQSGVAARLTLTEVLPPVTLIDGSGNPVQLENERRWKLICGSNSANLDQDAFEEIVRKSKESLEGPITVVSGGGAERGGIFNMVFNVSGSPPAGAVAALDAIAAYYETQFSDPVTVTFSVAWLSMGGGVLGATSSDYFNNVSYSSIRTNLVNSADFNDIIQPFLPTGATCPVRYDSTSATVTNQASMDVTEANWSAVFNNDFGGQNASIQINTDFPFDYDPSNGVSGTCFRSVMVHEVGHALGFVSSVDFGPGDMETLDIYRFQTTDGTGDYNPEDSAEFQVRPRLVHNNSPNNSHHTELMQSNGSLIEYQMADGNPDQASHWREGFGIGIMNPSIGSGITFAPNYLRVPDAAALDAIGWDYPAVDPGDLDPPTPNPMSFSIPPAGASATSISMQATIATDVETPPVQYQFDYTSGSAAGHDSAWLPTRDYVDTGLTPNNFYNYRVRAGDSRLPSASPPGPNATQYSGALLAFTFIETPLSVSFGATDGTSIVVNADGTFTNLGIGFFQTGIFFEMSPAAGAGANVWVDGQTITVTGLTPCTQYTFRVMARNANGTMTSFTSAAMQATTGCAGCSMLGDLNGSGAVEGGDIAGFVHAKLGTPQGGEFPDCADYATGTLEGDTAEFVDDLLGV